MAVEQLVQSFSLKVFVTINTIKSNLNGGSIV